jgi:hypothetical protein
MYDFVVIGNPTFQNGRLTGPSIYTAATVAKLGFEHTAIVSSVCPSMTENFIQGIDRLGIPEYFIVESNESGAKEILNPSINNEGSTLGIPDRISVGDIPKEFLNAQAILLSPSLQEIDAEFIEWICNSTDALVYLDPQLRILKSSGRIEVIREFSVAEKTQSYLDIIIPNQLESELITGESDPYLAAELIVEWASEACIITLGEDGSLVYDGKDFHTIPSYRTEEIDSEGAGAVFTAAFASQSIAGKTLIESAVYASAVASLKVEYTGLEFQTNDAEIHQRSQEIANSIETR